MTGSVWLVHGVIRGNEHEADCDILVCTQSPTKDSDYSDAFVLTAPLDLPDGDYFVGFEGHSMIATKRSGLWMNSAPILRKRSDRRPSKRP